MTDSVKNTAVCAIAVGACYEIQVANYAHAYLSIPALHDGAAFDSKDLLATSPPPAQGKYPIDEHLRFLARVEGLDSSCPLLVLGMRNNLVNLRAPVIWKGRAYGAGEEEPTRSLRPYYGLGYREGRLVADTALGAGQPAGAWPAFFCAGIPVLWDAIEGPDLFDLMLTETADHSHLFDLPRGHHPAASERTRAAWSKLHAVFQEHLYAERQTASRAMHSVLAGMDPPLRRCDNYFHAILGTAEGGGLLCLFAHGRLEDLGRLAARHGCRRAVCVENSGSVMPTLFPQGFAGEAVPLIRVPNYRPLGRAVLALELPSLSFESFPVFDRERTLPRPPPDVSLSRRWDPSSSIAKGRRPVMKPIFETEHPGLEGFKDRFPQSAEKLLSIVLWKDSSGLEYFIKGESTDSYFCCDESKKLRLEVARWRNALGAVLGETPDPRMLRLMSPALHSVYLSRTPVEVREQFARSLRMVLLYEALLLGDSGDCSPDNPYREAAQDLKDASVKQVVKEVVKAIREGQHRIGTDPAPSDGQWYVSLPLLLLVAIAESQCEHLQNFAWEAYSAGRVRDELLRLWAGIGEGVVNTVALLIRCQSAVGQRQRRERERRKGNDAFPGSDAFLSLVGHEQDESPRLAFTTKLRLDALRLMAIVEEARNHKVPSPPGAAAWPGIDAGALTPWDTKAFSDQAGLYASYDPPTSWPSPEPEYAFWHHHFIGLNSASRKGTPLYCFTETLWSVSKQQGLTEGTCRVISFGRDQTRAPLQALMGLLIDHWPTNPEDGERRFKTYFRVKPLEVPNEYSAQVPTSDRTLCGLLKDELAAERLLFPNGDLDALVQRWDLDQTEDSNAAKKNLFEYLLDRATEVVKDQGACWRTADGKDADYLPFPLVRRISDIVYRLRPESCFNIPIRIDGGRTRWVHIPNDVRKTDERTKNAIANLILGLVENRAMASGMKFAEIDLDNLAIHNCGLPSQASRSESPTRKVAVQYRPLPVRELGSNQWIPWMIDPLPAGGGGDRLPGNVSQMMRPEDWKALIEDLYANGGYRVLLGRYLRDYNTRRETVRLGSRLASNLSQASDEMPDRPGFEKGSTITPSSQQVAVGAVRRDLGNYLRARKQNCKEATKVCLIGVDIGGTLTKCQLFLYDDTKEEIEAVGELFRMATKPDPTALGDDDKGKGQADAFASRLVHLLKKEIDGQRSQFACPCRRQAIIGVSWPGPVRDGHIGGTSGALAYFPPLTRDIEKNAIEDIWRFDLVAAVKASWKDVFKEDKGFPEEPYVSLLNDGDAEAVGAIVRARSSASGKSGKTAVVKIGTGLAGGMLQGLADNGTENIVLVQGLYEWGKLILDVGAPPRRDFPFPQGAAAEYLSKRCLPRLAKREGSPKKLGDPGFFQRDDPDSAEIGLILDMSQSPSVPAFKRLINECGVMQAEKHPLRGVQIPAEVLRLVLDPAKSGELDDDLLHQVRLALVRHGDIEVQLKKDLKAYGLERLRRLTGYIPKKALSVRQKSQWRDVVHPKCKKAGEIAGTCVDLLGSYLGDFCVLLFDELSVNRVILTGGVLSGKTGEKARDAAAKRVRMYGLEMGLEETPATYSIRDSRHSDAEGNGAAQVSSGGTGLNPSGTKEDRGTLGAACFAAASFIQGKQHEGLKQLRACLLPLPTASELQISETTVRVKIPGTSEPAELKIRDDGGDRPIDFGEYALTKKDLSDFLTTYGPEWGYYQSKDDSFIRWLMRN